MGQRGFEPKPAQPPEPHRCPPPSGALRSGAGLLSLPRAPFVRCARTREARSWSVPCQAEGGAAHNPTAVLARTSSGLGKAIGHHPAPPPQQLSPGWERGRSAASLLPACGCFLTPPFVQTPPWCHPRCHDERHLFLSRVTVTTSWEGSQRSPRAD